MLGDRHHHVHDQIAGGGDERQRQHDAQRLDGPAPDSSSPRGLERERLIEPGQAFARGQEQCRGAHPCLARSQLLVVGRSRLHADQNVMGHVGAIGDVRAVADERTIADGGRAQDHPPAALLLVAEQHAVGDEALLAQCEQVRDHPRSRRHLGAAPHPGTHQPQPAWSENRRKQAVEHAQAGVVDARESHLRQ